MNDNRYGYCECGAPLEPVWFTKRERDEIYGGFTGREKIACSHLICPECLQTYIVDDSFDGPWQ